MCSEGDGCTREGSNPPTPVTHVIFDLDGTLVDSERYFYRAVDDTLHEYNASLDWEVRGKTIGLFMARSASIIIDHYQLPLKPEDYIHKVLVRFRSYVAGEIDGQGIQLLPGVRRLVEHFRDKGVPMAICTGSMTETYSYKVEPFGDFFTPGNLFHHVVLGGSDPEVSENKPHGDPYRVCMSRFTPQPSSPQNVLAFEDSPTGLTSALAAGCQCVLVPDPKLDLKQLARQPTMVIDSLEHFEPQRFGLPPFDS